MVGTWITISKDSMEKWVNAALLGPSINRVVTTGNTMLEGPDGIIQGVVDRIRGAIGAGNRCAFSLTANSIPPEARDHAMMLIVERLLGATPTVTDFAGKDIVEKACKTADDWLEAVRKGLGVTEPTNPDPVNSPRGPAFGSLSDFVDMGTDPVFNSVPTASSPPPAPRNVVALAGKGQVGLYWQTVQSVKYYAVYRATTAGGEVAPPLATTLEPWWIDTGLTSGTTYYYQVQAVSDTGGTGTSAEVSCTPA